MEEKKNEKSMEEFSFYWENPSENMAALLKQHSLRLLETEKEILVRTEVPGYKMDEINLHITENSIEISGEKKEEKVERTRNVFKQEKKSDAFRRNLILPEKV